MAIYRSQDSLSRCADSSAYLYDARVKTPPKSVEKVSSLPKDTLEISKETLKKEALSRLRHTTKQTVAYPGFLRIGKTLFLGIALPPYVLLYGLPKWVLLQAAALFAQFVPWLFRPIAQALQKKTNQLVQKAMALTQGIQQIVQRLLQPFVHLVLKTEKKAKKALAFLFTKAKQRAKRGLSALLIPFQLSKKALAFSSRLFRTLKEKSLALRLKSGKEIREGLPLIQQAKEGVKQWGLAWLGKIEQNTRSFRGSLRQKKELSQAVAQKMSLFLATKSQNVGRKLTFALTPIKGATKLLVSPFLALWKKGKDKGFDFFDRKQRQAQRFFSQQKKRLAALSASDLYHAFLGKLQEKRGLFAWRRLIAAGLSWPFFAKIAQAIASTWLRCLRGGVAFLECFWQMAVKCQEGLTSLVALFREQREKAKVFCRLTLEKSLLQIRKGAFSLLYHFLLFATMGVILLAWGVEYAIAYGEQLLKVTRKPRDS